MTNTPDPTTDMLAAVASAQTRIVDLVAGLDITQLDTATPCVDFTVADLLVHLFAVQERIGRIGEFGHDPETFVGHEDSAEKIRAVFADIRSRRIDGHSAADIATDLQRTAEAARSTWTAERRAGSVTLPWGVTVPGEAALSTYVMENLTHSWDLAEATDQPAEADPVLAAVGLGVARRFVPDDPAVRGDVFGPLVAAAEDAGPTEQLANWLGRRSDWKQLA